MEPPRRTASRSSTSQKAAILVSSQAKAASSVSATHVETRITSRATVPRMISRKAKDPPEIQEACKLNFNVFDDGSALVKEDTLFGWLVENGRALGLSKVKGSLARHSQAWSRVTSDAEILKTMWLGYAPPFLTCPLPFADKNNVSVTSNYSFVLKAVMEMLVNGLAKLTRTPSEVINPFTVSFQANGKKRIIADLRHLNQYLDPPKFKLEDIRAAMPVLKKAQYNVLVFI